MAVWIVLCGLVFGSFLNMLIYRLPLKISLLSPARSICPACQKTLPWWQLIPVLSFILLKGRCFFCTTRISWRYPVIELLCGFCFFLCFIKFGLTEKAIAAMIFIMLMIVLSAIDLEHMFLPDVLTLGLLWMGLFFNLNHTFVPLHEAVIGAMGAYGILYLIYAGFKFLTKKEGLGFGDLKLMAALGAWFGWEALPWLLLLSGILGLVLGIGWQYFKHRTFRLKLNQEFPFGPAIALSGLAWLFLC